MRRFSARTYLLGLLAVAIVPVWAFAAFLLISYALSEQRAYREQAVEIAHRSVASVDGLIAEMLVRLDSLSRTIDAADPNLAQLHASARRLIADTNMVVSMRNLEQIEVLRTDTQYGAPIPPPRQLSKDELEDFQVGRQRVSDIFIDRSVGPAISVGKPIELAGTVYLLEMTIATEVLPPVLKDVAPPNWIIGIADRQGVYVTRSERHEAVVGEPGLPDYLAKAQGDEGTFTSLNQFGNVLLAGYARSSRTGWLHAANVSLAVVEGPLWRSIYGLLAMAAVALTTSLALAYLLGRTLTERTGEIVNAALALGTRRPVARSETRLKEFGLINDALMKAESMLHERTQELEAVLATAPVAVWFTYDPTAREVIRNRYAAELMGLIDDVDRHFGRPDQVISTVAYKDGKSISRDDRPLSRAMRGEHIDGEEYSYVLLNGEKRELITSARPIFDHAQNLVGAVQVSMDITDRKRGEEQVHLLARELNHRVKNNLAIVQAITQQTLRHAKTLEEARGALVERLRALADAHEILTRNAWEAGSVEDVVEAAAGTQAPGQVSYNGPVVNLKPNLVMALSLALHELGTNALKYGSLSSNSGSVHIEWHRAHNPDRLILNWKEMDGPRVDAPTTTGFGSKLLERVTTGEGGTLTVDYAPAGIRAEISLPL